MSGSLPFLIAGFGLTWIVLAVYAWRLEARLGSARDRRERRGSEAQRVETPGSGTAADRDATHSDAGAESTS